MVPRIGRLFHAGCIDCSRRGSATMRPGGASCLSRLLPLIRPRFRAVTPQDTDCGPVAALSYSSLPAGPEVLFVVSRRAHLGDTLSAVAAPEWSHTPLPQRWSTDVPPLPRARCTRTCVKHPAPSLCWNSLTLGYDSLAAVSHSAATMRSADLRPRCTRRRHGADRHPDRGPADPRRLRCAAAQCAFPRRVCTPWATVASPSPAGSSMLRARRLQPRAAAKCAVD
jgi:hypothetical protein